MNAEAVPGALLVLMNGHAVGRIVREGGRLAFVYDVRWRAEGPDIPLSLSLPLSAARHEHEPVANWLWGLLPDNPHTLRRIAAEQGVSPTSVFALLWKLGEDCPGAVQLLDPERAAGLEQSGGVDWLDEAEIANRLARLRREPSLGRRMGEGQFSLAGAQPKTALLYQDGHWGLPSGRIPTTHILKPPIPDLDGHAVNEVFCLALARAVGLRAAKAEVRRFGGETAIVVERFDRVRAADGTLLRIHQEDLCQALGVHPADKYESDGGPGIRRVMDALTQSTSPAVDRRRFMEAVAFNALIGGTDAHAKNNALVFGPGQVRLAPLYDLASYLPHTTEARAVTLAMRIGRHRVLEDTQPRHWERLARECGYPAADAVGHVARLAAVLPEAAAQAAGEVRRAGGDHPVLGVLVERIGARCEGIARLWGLPS